MTDRTTLAGVAHAVGTTDDVGRAFHRGLEHPALTDGGRESDGTGDTRNRARRRETAPEGTMRDVSHTPVHGDGVNRVWHRGGGTTGAGEKGVHDRDAELAKERVSPREDEHEPR